MIDLDRYDCSTPELREEAMRTCYRDIQQILRVNWDVFAAADFYNEMINAYGCDWKCVRWTRNYNIMVIIVETYTGVGSDRVAADDIVFMARYDHTQPLCYRAAKHVTKAITN